MSKVVVSSSVVDEVVVEVVSCVVSSDVVDDSVLLFVRIRITTLRCSWACCCRFLCG